MKTQSKRIIDGYALDTFLSQYPVDESFDRVLERLSEDDLDGESEEEIIVISELYANNDPSNVAEYIQESRNNLLKLVEEVIKEEAL